MKTKDIIIGIGIMVLLILIDQLTKIWVVKSFEYQKQVKVIPKIINFKYTKNEGGAFSIFSGNIQREFSIHVCYGSVSGSFH